MKTMNDNDPCPQCGALWNKHPTDEEGDRFCREIQVKSGVAFLDILSR